MSSFWVEHGFHLALVAVPSATMGAGLALERRRGDRERVRTAEPVRAGPGPLRMAPRASTAGTPTAPRRRTDVPGATGERPSPTSVALPAVVVAAVGAALVHLVVMPEHFGESRLYGSFFLAAAAAQLLWAVVVTYRPGRQVLLAGGGGCAAVVLLWAASRTVGIPPVLGGVGAGAPEAVGPLDVLATAFEAVAAVGVVVALRGPALRRGSPLAWPRSAQAFAAVALCATAGVALIAPVN